MSIYLTEQEVIEATGRKYRAHQITYLRDEGWVFHVDAKGKPKILRSYAFSRGGYVESPKKEPRLRFG